MVVHLIRLVLSESEGWRDNMTAILQLLLALLLPAVVDVETGESIRIKARHLPACEHIIRDKGSSPAGYEHPDDDPSPGGSWLPLRKWPRRPSENRIMHGREVGEGNGDFMVTIGAVTHKDYPPRHICGGVLINSRIIVTAAHCFGG